MDSMASKLNFFLKSFLLTVNFTTVLVVRTGFHWKQTTRSNQEVTARGNLTCCTIIQSWYLMFAAIKASTRSVRQRISPSIEHEIVDDCSSEYSCLMSAGIIKYQVCSYVAGIRLRPACTWGLPYQRHHIPASAAHAVSPHSANQPSQLPTVFRQCGSRVGAIGLPCRLIIKALTDQPTEGTSHDSTEKNAQIT